MYEVYARPGIATLQFLAGSLTGNTFSLQAPITVIGSAPDCDIVLVDPSVQPHHARIVWQNGFWVIEALSPQGILRINQQSSVYQAQLKSNDLIGLGAVTTFTFFDTREVQEVSPVMFSPTRDTPANLAIAAQAVLTTAGAGDTLPGPMTGIGLPVLEIATNRYEARRIYPLTTDTISLGRDPRNDIVLDATIVSSFHLQIVRQGNDLILVHPHPSRQRTSNGLFYKGRHIPGDEVFRKPLTHGDVFRIGNESGSIITLMYNDGSPETQAIVPEISAIQLQAPVITIGRHPSNTVVLDHALVSQRHARIVQEGTGHRIIDLRSTNHVYVNGQQVVNQLLEEGDVVSIGPFALTYTGTELTPDTESNSIRIDALELRKTVKRIGQPEEVLLNDISLAIPPRSFVAIVGGSGTGKSTLIDALNGLRPAQDGTVLYNGQDYYRSREAFNTQLGYVPQDDIVHKDLTVERALYYAARMRLPKDLSRKQIWQRIDEVLDDVDMLDRRHLRIKKLSGGQRKRVSIALELLAQPSIFFLDEPTSGLDPGLDRKMMFLLRRLADRGHTIVLTTHATSNLNACDYVCFLAQGGRLVYFGPPHEAKAYFGTGDFAEIYTLVEPNRTDPDVPAKAEQSFKRSRDYQKYVAQPLNQGPAGQPDAGKKRKQARKARGRKARPRGLLAQFFLLSRRYIELLKNDGGTIFILLMQAPVIALIIVLLIQYGIGTGIFDTTTIVQCPTTEHILTKTGTTELPSDAQPVVSVDCNRVENFLLTTPQGKAYATQRGGEKQALQDFILPDTGGYAQEIIFTMVFAAIMFGCINAAREIVKEEAVYRRERAVNLRLLPYLASKIVVLGMLCLVQTAILVGIINAVVPFQHSIFLPPLLEVYITLALASLAGMMLGLTVSAIAPSTDRAMSFVPVVLIPQVLLSGALFPFMRTSTQILAMFSVSRWAMAALGSSIGLHSDKMLQDTLFHMDPIYQGTLFSIYTQQQAKHYLELMWGVLLGIMLLLLIVIIFFQKRKEARAAR